MESDNLVFHDFVTGKICTIAEFCDEALEPIMMYNRLSRLVRFQGHPGALTVVEHMVLCTMLADGSAPTSVVMDCLVHDVDEAFLGDYNGWHKPAECKAVEARVEDALRLRGWRLPTSASYKMFDALSLAFERQMLWPDEFGTLSREHLRLIDRARNHAALWPELATARYRP